MKNIFRFRLRYISICLLIFSLALLSFSDEAHSKIKFPKLKRSSMTTQPLEGYTMTSTGLQFKDETVGSGTEAKSGDKVAVHYVGTLFPSGDKFDSSLDRGKPFEFRLGAGQVIKGWDEGVAGMKIGGRRILIIPPNLGYGAGGYPPVIPPSSTLKFEVELLEVK